MTNNEGNVGRFSEGDRNALKRFLDYYSEPPEFRAGDFVIGADHAIEWLRGRRGIVLETALNAQPVFRDDGPTLRFGARPDMRIAVLVDDLPIPVWVERFDFEPYCEDERGAP